MSFEDLPPNWTTLPLSTPHLAGDVVDLVLKESLRAENSMLLLPCDAHDVAFPTPVVISDVDWFVADDERREMLEAFASLELSAVVVAVSSSRRLPEAVVEQWHSEALRAFAAVDTRLIGFFTAWPDVVEESAAPEQAWTR